MHEPTQIDTSFAHYSAIFFLYFPPRMNKLLEVGAKQRSDRLLDCITQPIKHDIIISTICMINLQSMFPVIPGYDFSLDKLNSLIQ